MTAITASTPPLVRSRMVTFYARPGVDVRFDAPHPDGRQCGTPRDHDGNRVVLRPLRERPGDDRLSSLTATALVELRGEDPLDRLENRRHLALLTATIIATSTSDSLATRWLFERIAEVRRRPRRDGRRHQARFGRVEYTFDYYAAGDHALAVLEAHDAMLDDED